MTEPSLPDLEAERDRLYAQLARVGDFRRGSVSENYRKCGKPNCACAQPGHRGHGPQWNLTRRAGHHTVVDQPSRDERSGRATAVGQHVGQRPHRRQGSAMPSCPATKSRTSPGTSSGSSRNVPSQRTVTSWSAKPAFMCSPRRRATSFRSSSSRKNTRSRSACDGTATTRPYAAAFTCTRPAGVSDVSHTGFELGKLP